MRIKGVKAVTVRKRGLVYRYYYHRATNTRLKAEYGTATFASEVAALDAKAKASAPRDGSLGALITAYKGSIKFPELAARTKKDYQRVFDYLDRVRDMGVAEIDPPFVYGVRDAAFKKHKRRFANYVVQVLSLLFKWGKQHGYADSNPAEDIDAIKRPKNMPRANRPWSDEERDTVLQEADIEVRLVIALGMFAALREGDACALPRSAHDGARIETIAAKNREHVWIPAHYRLREILAEAFVARREHLTRRARRKKVLPIDPPTLAVTSRGKAWTPSGFRASFFRLIKALERAKKVQPGLTFHGLRHTLGKLIIEAGGTKEDVGMILSDRSLAMAEHYSRDHDKKERVTATMHRLEQRERARKRNESGTKNE